jgi:hypothetical protein
MGKSSGEIPIPLSIMDRIIHNAYVLSSHCLNYISGKESIYAGKIHGA